MKPQFNSIALRAGAVAGFIATAAIGWHLAGDATPSSNAGIQADNPPATRGSAREPRHRGRYHTPDHAKERLRAIRAAGSPGERMRATIELVNSLPVSELEAWLEGRWFDDSEGFDLSLFNKIARERWLKEDPEGLALWSMKNGGGSANSILRSWAESEPQRVLAFFKEHPNQQMELQMLQTIAGKDPAGALGRLREMIDAGLDTNNIEGYYANQVLQELVKNNSAALEAMLDSLPTQWRNSAEGTIIAGRLQTSFSEEIQKLYERPDGWKVFEQAINREDGLSDKLFDELANLPDLWKASLASNYYQFMNSSNAEIWLDADLTAYGFSEEQAKRIQNGALNNLSWNKPEAAFKLMANMDLSDNERKSMISNAISRARGDSEKAETLIAMLGSEEDRQFARNALANISGGSKPDKIEQPAEWLEQASSFDPKTGNGFQLFSQIERWDSAKIAELTNEFRSMPDDQKLKAATLIAGRSDDLDPSLAGEAIRYLMTNPEPTQEDQYRDLNMNPTRLASNHVAQWAGNDPIAASAWVNSLPSGEAKLWAQKNRLFVVSA